MSMPGSLGLVDDGPYAACGRCGADVNVRWYGTDEPVFCPDCAYELAHENDDEDEEHDHDHPQS